VDARVVGQGTRVARPDAGARGHAGQLELTAVQALGPDPDEITAFTYDAAGNLTQVTDPRAQQTAYAYDALSRLASVTQHLNQTVQYRYDGRGRLSRVVNARLHALDYVYEDWGPLQAVYHYATEAAADADPEHTSADRTVTYGYDLAGNLTSTSDSDILGGASLYSADPTTGYDALNRLSSLNVQYLPGGGRTLDYAYDRFGNRKTLTLTDGAEVFTHSYVFDKLDRLDTATFPGNASAHDLDYRANGDLEKITAPSGVVTDYLYEPNGPVDDIRVTDGTSQELLRLAYGYDEVLNVDSLAETVAGTTYTHDYDYDEVYRLIQRSQSPAGLNLPALEDFTYDLAGNREDPGDPAAYDYDANNRITASPGSLTYTFDADGNIESRSGGATFTYDRINRLRQFTLGGTIASYLYDPFGRRIKKTVGSADTWYVWDGDRLLAEFDGTGTRQARYAYAAGFAPMQLAEGATLATETRYDVHTDHLDTPRALTDQTGVVRWRASYQAFGTPAVDEDPDGDLTNVAFNVRFPGQYADSESGFHYNFFRDYDPQTGRYLEPDPIGQAGGLALYPYAEGDPVNLFDFFGQQEGQPPDVSILARARYYIQRGDVEGLKRFLSQFEGNYKQKQKLLRDCGRVFKKKAKQAEREFRANDEFRDYVHRNYKPDMTMPGENPNLGSRELINALEEFFKAKR
jgi:RHS repeat-associated protein